MFKDGSMVYFFIGIGKMGGKKKNKENHDGKGFSHNHLSEWKIPGKYDRTAFYERRLENRSVFINGSYVMNFSSHIMHEKAF